jgi:hypothetical protein
MAAVMDRFDGRRALRASAAIAVLGIAAMVLGVLVDARRAMCAYLVAWAWVTTIAIGALGFLLIGYACNARWVAIVRRLVETVALALVPCAVLFVPLALTADRVWPWVHPDAALAAELAPRAAWLSWPGFVLRSAAYLIIGVIAIVVLARRSRARDDDTPRPVVDEDEPPLGFERAFASAMLPAVGLAASFAGFDWLMSLEPTWWSSAFGLYVVAGAMTAGLAAVIVIGARERLAMGLTPNHFHALGRMLLAFTLFWGYLAYFQAFLIRIANLPAEVTFFVRRLAGGWRWVTYALIAAHLAIPLPLLIPKLTKVRPRLLAAIAALLLVAHYVDLWWIVIPTVDDPIPSWIDLAALAAVGGTVTAVIAWRAHGVPRVAAGDPYLPASLHYASPT